MSRIGATNLILNLNNNFKKNLNLSNYIEYHLNNHYISYKK